MKLPNPRTRMMWSSLTAVLRRRFGISQALLTEPEVKKIND
jgi:hypothetical protein